MSYRNKTYVVFDGNNEMWAYACMKDWNESDDMKFDLDDSHHLRPTTDWASKDTARS